MPRRRATRTVTSSLGRVGTLVKATLRNRFTRSSPPDEVVKQYPTCSEALRANNGCDPASARQIKTCHGSIRRVKRFGDFEEVQFDLSAKLPSAQGRLGPLAEWSTPLPYLTNLPYPR